MKIEGYTYKIDMTPKMVHVYIELPGEGEGKFITDERPEYTQEQKAEFDNARAFISAQIPSFLEVMKNCNSLRIVGEDMDEPTTWDMLKTACENPMNLVTDFVGLTTEKGHLFLDADYDIVWG